MIGGHDIVVSEKASVEKLGEILLRIGNHWPSATMEFDVDDEVGVQGVFVYENATAQQSWTDHGQTEDNDKQVIYILLSDDSTTLVVDRPGSELCAFVERVLATLWPEWTPS